MSTETRTFGVVGSGQMGRGIARTAAQAGFQVTLSDLNRETAQGGKDTIARSLDRLVSKEKITQDQRTAILDRIHPIDVLGEHAGATIVIEAATENEALKTSIFQQLDAALPPETLLGTNTSSISITRLAGTTTRPGRVIGMHFMNPVPIMKLVEVIRGIATEDATCATTVSLAEAMGKTVVTSEDYPGFIVNRILMPMINEAAFVLMEGVASAKDIDTAMHLGTNQPMGPLADFIGLDTCLSIMEVLHEGLGDSKYRPCPLLRQRVDAGWLGRKTGRGFHSYQE